MRLNELTSLPLLFAATGAAIGCALSLLLFASGSWVHVETSAPALGFLGTVAGLLVGTIYRRSREITRSSQTLSQVGLAAVMFGATLVAALVVVRKPSDLMVFDSIFFALGGIMLLAGQVSLVFEGVVDVVILCFCLAALVITHDLSWLVLALIVAMAVYGAYVIRHREERNPEK